MERGLLWLPLLASFSILAWLGWAEYRKVEAYRAWAKSFDYTKYDLYAMLGWKDGTLTWGKPTRQGGQSMQSISLAQVSAVQLWADQQLLPDPLPDPLPSAKLSQLELLPQRIRIPFSQLDMAVDWQHRIRQAIKSLSAESQTPGSAQPPLE